MHVAPTFLTPTVTDTTVEISWNINGDTPAKVRVYTRPGFGSPMDVQPIQNSYKWIGLDPPQRPDAAVLRTEATVSLARMLLV